MSKQNENRKIQVEVSKILDQDIIRQCLLSSAGFRLRLVFQSLILL